MDTMKVLLGATFGLLLALVVLAFNDLDDKKSSESEELQRLRLERQRLKELQSQPPVSVPAFTPAAPQAKPEMAEETARRLAELERSVQAANARQAELESAALAASIPEPEDLTLEPEDLALEPAADPEEEDRVEKRSRAIVNAIAIGQVSVFEKDANFVAFRVLKSDLIEPGMTLGIRRNRGIVGRVNVDSLEGGDGIGTPLISSFFKGIDINIGDELIIPPL